MLPVSLRVRTRGFLASLAEKGWLRDSVHLRWGGESSCRVVLQRHPRGRKRLNRTLWEIRYGTVFGFDPRTSGGENLWANRWSRTILGCFWEGKRFLVSRPRICLGTFLGSPGEQGLWVHNTRGRVLRADFSRIVGSCHFGNLFGITSQDGG